MGKGGDGREFGATAAGVLADDALVGLDAQDIALALHAVARLIDSIEAVVVFAEILRFVLVGMGFDFGDDGVGHGCSLCGVKVGR